MELKRQIGIGTAILIIAADMIGTGIFMTTGNTMSMTGGAVPTLLLWGIGGMVAVAGSYCYSELATIWPDNGGEYVYLKKIYGLMPSFLTGWISLFIGFSLAASMSVITAVKYLNELAPGGIVQNPWILKGGAALIIFIFGAIHISGVRKGGLIQNLLTILKLVIVAAFILLGFYYIGNSDYARLFESYPVDPQPGLLEYGAALVVIMYAYSGWNGAAYIAGEIKDPQKNLKRAMIGGTLLVTVFYIALNFVFIAGVPSAEIIGKDPVGAIVANSLFGAGIAPVFTLSIAILLLSSVSVQMMIGPRVYNAMAVDGAIFRSLARINPKFETPDLAIAIQIAISVFYVFIGFGAILKLLIYIGFALGIFPLMAVIGLLIHRFKNPKGDNFSRLTPVFAVFYIVLTSGMMAASLITRTATSLSALAVLAAGVVVFMIWKKFAVKSSGVNGG